MCVNLHFKVHKIIDKTTIKHTAAVAFDVLLS